MRRLDSSGAHFNMTDEKEKTKEEVDEETTDEEKDKEEAEN